ncbi:MAG TPA: DUF1684 domain-containing protein [Bacteroidales bacterium]|nr:DUF1684 domain-containing protein [Bacteroidales bacterium]HSA44338.1 DUF1684 domain-containing protein [Bacteroidales bacterium]
MIRKTGCLLLPAFLFLYFSAEAQTFAIPDTVRTNQLAAVIEHRIQKDAEFRTAGNSPLPEEDLHTFEGLHYFPYDTSFCVMARLERNPDPPVIRMKTTTDRRPEYRIFGTLHFSLLGKSWHLSVFQPVELSRKPGYERYLFLPFTDETSGRETYGGGRFLELQIPEGDRILLDFNSCFNPYCAYHHKYSCPVPPEENDLGIRVTAGELPFKH